jgi:flagellar hook-basal body complex protein FliE
MILPIQMASVGSTTAALSTRPAAANGFAAMVGNAAQDAMQSLHQAEATTASGVAGHTDVQGVVQALSNAEVTLQTVVAVRDKVLGAYSDIMHMSV